MKPRHWATRHTTRWSALIVTCAVARAAHAAEWVVSQTLPTEQARNGFQQYVAEIGKPTEIPVAVGQDVRPVVRSLCGDSANEAYQTLLEKLNPKVKNWISGTSGILRLPACVRYYREREVNVRSASTVEQELLKANGAVPSQLLAQTYDMNPWLKDTQGRIDAGRSLKLAAVVPPSSIELKYAFTGKSAQITKRLTQLAGPSGVTSAETTDDVKLVTMIDPASFDAAAECANTSAQWPFDREAVLRALAHLRRTSQTAMERSLVVAADTGIPADFSGIPGSLFFRNPYEIDGDLADNDGNGFIDDLVGTNVRTLTGFPAYFATMPAESGSHGTSVSAETFGGPAFYSIAEHLEDRIGVRVANLVSRRVTASTNGPSESFYIQPADLVTAVHYATKAGRPAILNFSVETPTNLTTLSNAMLEDSYLLVVAAAGNDGEDVGLRPVYPAAHGGIKAGLARRVISVAAHGPSGRLLSFSNHGELIDLAAPGCEVESIDASGGRVALAGTSIAAPLVTFAAALLRSSGVVSPQALKNRIVSSVDFDPALFGKVASGGRLNIPRALTFGTDTLALPGKTGFVPGNAQLPPTIASCGNSTPSGLVLKITGFKRVGDNAPMVRILRKDGVGDLTVDVCAADALEIPFVRSDTSATTVFRAMEGGDLTLKGY